jgi:membrane protease subunit HflK
MYLETMQKIMPSVESIYIMDENQQTPLPLLNLSRGNNAISAPAAAAN